MRGAISRARQRAVPVRRTQAERRETSNRELVRAAVAIVAEEGVSAATFQAIGARSGYHRSLVTQRFGARAGLIDAILEFLLRRTAELHEQEQIDQLPGLEALLKSVDIWLLDLAGSHEKRAYFMLLSSAVAELDPLRSAYAGQHERVKQRVRALVERGQADGTIRRSIDADAAAVMIGSVQLGLSMQLLVDPSLDLEPVRATARETLRLGFAA